MTKVILILIIAILFWAGNKGFQNIQEIPKRDIREVDLDKRMLIEDLLKEAKAVINDKTDEDEDLTVGPCLLNPSEINEDYVVDIAHDPRTEEDNKKDNQCSAYTEGKSKHFVEVDESGKLIRFN